MQTQRLSSSKETTLIGSLVIAACLTFSPSLYETARGFSTVSVSSTVSNAASKGDRLTNNHPNTSARTAAGAEQVTAKRSGKIPIGCEAAFSQLVHLVDFSARRCVT